MEPRPVIAARTCTCPPDTPEYEYSKECVFHRVDAAKQIERFFVLCDRKHYSNYV